MTLKWWKFYLESCILYHTFFVRELLWNIHEVSATVTGRCNAGTTVSSKRGAYRDFNV